MSIKGDSMKIKNICLFGDSITRGIGVPDEKYSWSNIVSDYYNSVNIMNHGVGGQTTSAAIERLDDVLADSPQITTVQFGMNDHCLDKSGNFKVNQNTFRENLILIIESLYSIKSKVILITNHNVIEGNEEQYYYHRHPQYAYIKFGGVNIVIEQYNEIIRELSVKYSTNFIEINIICKEYDKYKFLRSLKNSEYDDGVHPHILGSQIYAQEVIKTINKIIVN